MSKGRGGGGIRVVVAAAASARRSQLEMIIRGQPDFHLTASLGALARLSRYFSDPEIDVIVAEADSLPQLSEPANAAIVLLVQHTDARTTARLLKSGVRSILPRDSYADEIISAIYAVYGGHALLSSEAAEQLAAIYADGDPQQPESSAEEITPREGEVLRMMAEGLANKRDRQPTLHLRAHCEIPHQLNTCKTRRFHAHGSRNPRDTARIDPDLTSLV